MAPVVLALYVMKEKLKSIADELSEDLARCPDLRAQQLIDLDETISERIVKFELTMRPDQGDEWAALTDEEKTDSSIVATRRLETLSYGGTRCTTTQSTCWPDRQS